jgi:hypothetical protein
MNEAQQVIQTISLAMGVAWASGINLYAALLTLGIMHNTGSVVLPAELEVVASPAVMIVSGILFFIEFFADKIPGLDSTWDAIHTFIRIPAGAILAASAVGTVTPELMVAAGLLGGIVTTSTHSTKSGTRILVNSSPEPFSNWTLSLTEDIAVIVGLWTALNFPYLFIGLFVVFCLALVWFLPKLWRAIKILFSRIGRLFGLSRKDVAESTPALTD